MKPQEMENTVKLKHFYHYQKYSGSYKKNELHSFHSISSDKNSHKLNPSNKLELGKNIKFSFLVDQDTGKIKIRVYNFVTGEIIQEIPSEHFLKFLKELKEGVDEEALKKSEFIPSGLFLESEG